MPEFSVIVPVYNVGKYIRRCVDSILAQTYSKFEMILVDDGSTDMCGDICDEYARKDSRICVIHQKNQGVSSARNQGLLRARGKYIIFVDSDDTIDENYLQHMKNVDEEVDLVICGVNHVYSDGTIERRTHYKSKTILDLKSKDVLDMIKKNALNSIYDKRFRRERIEQLGLRYNCEMNLGEDTLFVANYVCICNKIRYIEQDLYNYHKYEHETLSAFDDTYAIRLDAANKKIGEVLSKSFENITEDIIWKQRCFDVFHYSIFEILKNNDYKKVEKIRLLKNICKIKDFRELSQRPEIYMGNDSRLIQLIVQSKSPYVIWGIWELIMLKHRLIK